MTAHSESTRYLDLGLGGSSGSSGMLIGLKSSKGSAKVIDGSTLDHILKTHQTDV